MIRVPNTRAGFALPTILIASMVMLIVLITSVSATSSVRSGLDGQYYTQLAREAAESGLARANGCLQDSSYVPTWNSSTLYPNTPCSGGSPCTNAASCFVTQRSTVRTTFSVGPPENSATSQIVRSQGKVELLRASNGEVWRTYSYTASARVSADLSLGTVAFGYVGGSGAYFATIAGDGKVRATGYNGQWQLGNGTTANTLTPTPYKLPGNTRATALFTNFLSQGYNLYALTSEGKIFGAGRNTYGQLGDGTTTGRSTPVEYGLPAGVKGKYVGMNGNATYVIGSDNNIYATGLCDYGLLGSNYTIAGCANRSTYVRVNIQPLPNVADLNTIPTNNIVSDYYGTLVRMQGGRVWGWGINQNGHLANGTVTSASNPVKIGTFGDAGKPKAVDVQYDGRSIWLVDDAGKAWAAGLNNYGQVGGGTIMVDSLDQCIDDINGDGLDVQYHTCNDTASQDWIWRSDKTIYSVQNNKCINAVADGTVSLATCSSSTAQKFTFRNDRSIHNTSTGKCLNNQGNDGNTIIVYTCGTQANTLHTLPHTPRIVPVGLPTSAGNAIKVVTDQWFAAFLTSNGEVWGTGVNNRGQLGNGTTSLYQPSPVKFILPVGVTAKDVYIAAHSTVADSNYNNTFVVGSDGRVYGAGANTYGQLGNGNTTDASTPVAMNTTVIDGVTVRAKQVVTGWGTTVVITEDKKVYTVGNNQHGQLGDGTTTNSVLPKANRYTNVLPVTSF